MAFVSLTMAAARMAFMNLLAQHIGGVYLTTYLSLNNKWALLV